MRVAIVLFLLAITGPASAFCIIPDQPTCAAKRGKFDDEWDFQRCRRQVVAMKEQSEEAIQCLRREFEEVVDGFNRRAKSDY